MRQFTPARTCLGDVNLFKFVHYFFIIIFFLLLEGKFFSKNYILHNNVNNPILELLIKGLLQVQLVKRPFKFKGTLHKFNLRTWASESLMYNVSQM